MPRVDSAHHGPSVGTNVVVVRREKTVSSLSDMGSSATESGNVSPAPPPCSPGIMLPSGSVMGGLLSSNAAEDTVGNSPGDRGGDHTRAGAVSSGAGAGVPGKLSAVVSGVGSAATEDTVGDSPGNRGGDHAQAGAVSSGAGAGVPGTLSAAVSGVGSAAPPRRWWASPATRARG